MSLDMSYKRIQDWPLWKKDGPFIISGPCSAESEEQVLTTARQLKDSGLVSMFRAGIWKPRTRPGSFEGTGEKALPWLKKVKEETGLPVCIEVATADHVEKALKFGIDWLWIGARTTVNPFSVQEIAEALKGHQGPVMVKNPITPDLGLWVGAFERLLNQGVTKLVGIHRGFKSLHQGPYRNAPLWRYPLELKQHFPDIPLICDPSHIAGKRSLIEDISQKAINIGLDGLMLEVHPSPSEALSDPLQQLTPADLIKVLGRLNPKMGCVGNELNDLRLQIDHLDHELLDTLSERMRVVEEIGQEKLKGQASAFQLERLQHLLKERSSYSKGLGLSGDFVKELFQVIHSFSVKKQLEVMEKSKK